MQVWYDVRRTSRGVVYALLWNALLWKDKKKAKNCWCWGHSFLLTHIMSDDADGVSVLWCCVLCVRVSCLILILFACSDKQTNNVMTL